MSDRNFEVVIIGGSYAGLSAAMALGRSLRKVLIIDSGLPCNRQTPHSHNFLSRDGEAPAMLAFLSREQVMKYETVHWLDDLAVSSSGTANNFRIITASGKEFFANKLVIASGITDQMPAIPGFANCWGITVVHCPYCHGYEFKNKRTAIVANGERAFHLASLVNNLSNELSIITSGGAQFSEEQKNKLHRNGIAVIEKSVSEFLHDNGRIHSVIFDDGQVQNYETVYASVPFNQHSDIPAQLACEFTEHGHIKVDHYFKTTVPGVYACGDSASPMRSVATAVYGGNLVGAMVNKELTDERF